MLADSLCPRVEIEAGLEKSGEEVLSRVRPNATHFPIDSLQRCQILFKPRWRKRQIIRICEKVVVREGLLVRRIQPSSFGSTMRKVHGLHFFMLHA